MLAWLAVTAFSVICLFMYRHNKQRRARELESNQAFHEAFMACHSNDLCNYCDAFKTGDGEVHHLPSCSRR
jgi:hypothetical protein